MLKHPIFWSVDKKIQLIVEASDHFIAVPTFLQNLTATERKMTTELAKKWVSQVDGNILDSMWGTYRDDNFGELVRFFRNCKCHYSETNEGFVSKQVFPRKQIFQELFFLSLVSN